MSKVAKRKLMTGLLAGLLTCSALANDATDSLVSIGRYTQVKAAPTSGQMDVLSALTRFHFSENVSSVGEAIPILLTGSGYSLKRTEGDSVLLENRLPDVHRNLTAMPVLTALQTLAGSAWDIETDEVTRQIAFRLGFDKTDEVDKMDGMDGLVAQDSENRVRSEISAIERPRSYFQHQCGESFTFHHGMLYENLGRAFRQCGYALGYWHIGDSEYFIDMPIRNSYSLNIERGVIDILDAADEIYGVAGTLNEKAKTVDIYRSDLNTRRSDDDE